MSTPVAVLRIDTSGTAFGATPTYTDRTAYLMSGSSYPVEITRGRQDERSEPDAASCSFFLKNDTGFWSPGNAAAPANWRLGCPVQVQLTHSAVTYDRFTGLVRAIEPTWPGGVQSWSVVKVTATDVSARLGVAKPLRSLLLHEMLDDDPTYLYPLGEATGATSAATIVGTATPMVARDANGGGSATFGASTPLFDPASGVDFSGNTPAAIPGDQTALTYLDIPVFAPATAAFTIEQWVVMPAETAGDVENTFYEDRPPLLGQVNMGFTVDGYPAFGLVDSAQTGAVTGTTSLFDGQLHHLVGVLDSDRKTVRLYVDGVQIGSDTAAAVFSLSTGTRASLGAAYSSAGGFYNGPFRGVISHHVLYPSALSAARVLAHYQAGVGTGPAERSDERFSRIAGYGGITTSGLPTGKATMGGQRTSGRTAVEALKDVARTEGTAAYVTGAGALTFQARDNRYQKAVGLSLTASDIEPNFLPRQDDQGQFNELTVTRPTGASQVVVDSAAQTSDGRLDGGSFEVAPSTDEDAWQNASWQVANHKAPLTRLPALEVNLLARSDAIVTSCLQADISTVVQVTALPSNAPATSITQFIEGWTETISVNNWRMSFFTSPVVYEDDVLVLDSGTVGILDTNRLGF